jgi:ribokinase
MGVASMPILNLGSLNIDRVFRVDHIARPGETIAGKSLGVFAGGKGANQSVALARAGARVAHAGKIGADGRWLLETLAQEGIDTRWVRESSGTTGQAMIQVDDTGENAIVLFPGANHEITPDEVDEVLENFPADTWLLTQNETSAVGHAIARAHERGLRIALNPAPFDRPVLDDPLECVNLLCVNQTEGAAMTGEKWPDNIVAALAARLPECEILLTVGSAGVHYRCGKDHIHLKAPLVAAVDTTAAGDTFLGYFLANRDQGRSPQECLEIAVRAAAICITRPGAIASIPRRGEVDG